MPEPETYPDASEIRWTVTNAEPPLERVDLLTLTEEDLLAYTWSLQRETRWLRALLHESLAQVAEARVALDRSGVRIDRLVTDRREGARREADR